MSDGTARSADASSGEPTRHPLSRLFEPRSVVLYGASDRSPWSNVIFNATRASGHTGPMYAVNLRGVEAHGLAGFVSAKDLPERVDAAYVLVPAEGVFSAFEDLGAAGITAAVLLTSGFAETGTCGQEQQKRLVDLALKLGIRFLGPNSLGFANFSAGVALTSIPPTRPIYRDARIALVSQSGAMGSEIMEFAHQQGVGLSFFASTGNEAMLDIASVMDFLIDDPRTAVIAVFAEAIRDPDRLRKVAQRAHASRKPIVMLKVGTSALSAAVAMAHTGSLVGDDRVFEAACLQHGIIRVSCVEELITTAALLAHTGVIDRAGVAVVSISGGACGLFSDAAEKFKVPLPAFGPETIDALRSVQSSYGTVLNPFDITGAAVGDPTMFEKCLDIIGRDPSMGLTLCAFSMATEAERMTMSKRLYAPIGAALSRLGRKGLLVNTSVRPVNATALAAMAEAKIPAVLGGIDHVVRAIGKAVQWTAFVRGACAKRLGEVTISGQRPTSEREVLDYLSKFGVPVIPARIVNSAPAAAAAARELGGKVALKIASPDIQHKTDVGGVRLGLEGDEAVIAAYDSMLTAVRAAKPEARIDGVIVSPMRERGLELILGAFRDPQWGPMIVIGLGGVFVEALRDTALRLQPIAPSDVIEMLGSLRAAKLLGGYRGAPAADLSRIGEVAANFAAAALSLGPSLAALEINPLRVSGSEIEALDGLAVWSAPQPDAGETS
jgi:acyl-CoA synthetase (NDP forming)